MSKKQMSHRAKVDLDLRATTASYTLDAALLDLTLLTPDGKASRPWVLFNIGADGQTLRAEIKTRLIKDDHNA